MLNTTQKTLPYDLLSNFLTHSYFDLLEKFYIYYKHSSDTTHAKRLLQSLQSFLFIFQNNPKHLDTLQHQIFDYYPHQLTKDTVFPIKNKTSFRKIRIAYNQSILQLPLSPQELTLHNTKLIHNYYALIFSNFTKHPTIPKLFTAASADVFILEMWKYYVSILLANKNHKGLMTHLTHFNSKKFRISNELSEHVLKQIYTLPPSQDLDTFKNHMQQLL